MPRYPAPGLPADWLNGWLAAIGITVLLPTVRLSWSEDAIPHAVLHSDRVDLPNGLAALLYEALPDEAQLDQLPIARKFPGVEELQHNVSIDPYLDRVPLERERPLGTLSATVTDLAVNRKGELANSPFNPGVSKGRTLWERVVACRRELNGADDIAASLAGYGRRVEVNGLGFDVRRIASRIENPGKWADPAIELLTFAALPLFPVRGEGRRATARGWTDQPGQRGAFSWGTWGANLDRWAIDAWLDAFHAKKARDVTTRFTSVPYRPDGNDPTRGFASESH